MKRKIVLNPIGWVRIRAESRETGSEDALSEIVVRSELADCLDGLEDFSHVLVIFWMHMVSESERRRFKVHPKGRKDLPPVGVFATRSPSRPNPIGASLVRLVSVKENVVVVKGLDAYDRTPVLDLKPLVPWREVVQDLRVPSWFTSLRGNV